MIKYDVKLTVESKQFDKAMRRIQLVLLEIRIKRWFKRNVNSLFWEA